MGVHRTHTLNGFRDRRSIVCPPTPNQEDHHGAFTRLFGECHISPRSLERSSVRHVGATRGLAARATWNQVFTTVDELSRRGEILLFRRGFTYEVEWSAARPKTFFCVG